MANQKNDKDFPWWVVNDHGDGETGFVKGYPNEQEARDSADERNARAKKMGVSANYVATPKGA